jgi:hypothetical protein
LLTAQTAPEKQGVVIMITWLASWLLLPFLLDDRAIRPFCVVKSGLGVLPMTMSLCVKH